LNRLLDGGRSFDAVSIEANFRNQEKLIAHQNLQIEFLQEKNHQLERKLQDCLNEKLKTDDLLVRDMKEMNRMAKKAEIEKQIVANAADRELDQAKIEIKRSRDELHSLDSIVQQLEMDKVNLINELNCLKSELDTKSKEMNNLHTLIDKIQDDKSKLSKKISKLLENERELVQELDLFKSGKRMSSSANAANRNSLTLKLDAHIKNIETERDYYKQECDVLQKLLKAAQQHDIQLVSHHGVSGRSGASQSPGPRRSLSNSHHSRKESRSGLGGIGVNRTKSTSPTKCSVCAGRNRSASTRAKSPSLASVASQHQQIQQHNDEVKQLRRERDELKALLDKFERHMSDIQSNVKVLTSERDKYAQLYDESKEELQSARRDWLKNNSKASNASLATQALLKRVETERETAMFDLRNAINDRDAFRERLRLTSEASIKEKAALESQIDELQSMLRSAEFDRKELAQQVSMLRDQLNQMDGKLQEQNYQLVQTEQDLNDHKSASTQIRMMAEDSERALDEHRRQLCKKNDEIQSLEQANYRLEQKLIDMQELNRSLKDELNNLRMTIGALDKDKDKLLVTIDEKTVENVQMKQELTAKHRRVDELNTQLAQLDTALDRANDEIKGKLKEITQLRIQVEQLGEENGDLARRLESCTRENKRLQDDLITVTRENQVIHCELEKTNSDKDHLKDQLQDYINEVGKFEELLNQKEQDRGKLLDQYKDITNELNNMKMALNSFESETNNLQMELQMKHADNKRLREKLDVCERELQQQLGSVQEYEVKMSSANRNIQRLEETLKHVQLEHKEIVQDLMHTRELNSRLEQAKEDLTRQLTGKELDYEQMLNELNDKKVEIDLMRSQVNSERTMVKNLEELIASNREKDFQMQLCNQERDSEIKLLKDRIQLGEQKIQSQNKEITCLRSKLVEYESDNERLKRQLTNERFERERAAQELRKMSEHSATTHAIAAAEYSQASSRFMNRSLSPPPLRALVPPPPHPPVPIGVPVPLPLPLTSATTSSLATSSNSNNSAAAAAVAAAAAAVAASNVA
jgi:centrosomal protein CEP135